MQVVPVVMPGHFRPVGTTRISPTTSTCWRHRSGWATKEQVAKAVVARYPELRAYLIHDRKWKERFHENKFDAVALGMMATI